MRRWRSNWSLRPWLRWRLLKLLTRLRLRRLGTGLRLCRLRLGHRLRDALWLLGLNRSLHLLLHDVRRLHRLLLLLSRLWLLWTIELLSWLALLLRARTIHVVLSIRLWLLR